MRKRLGDFLPLILVVVVGLGILLYPTVSNFLVERNASRVISNYDAAVANLTEEEYAQMLDDAHAYNSKVAALAGVQPIDGSIDVSGISAETLRQEYNGLLNLNGDGMMGYITIPSLDVTMPIYHTVEEPVLQVGAGHVETRSCCSMAAIIAPSYLQTPCSGGFFISRVWKPPGTMAQDSTQSRLFPWATTENAPNRVVFFSPYGPFMEKSAFVCRKSRNPRVEIPPQRA